MANKLKKILLDRSDFIDEVSWNVILKSVGIEKKDFDSIDSVILSTENCEIYKK